MKASDMLWFIDRMAEYLGVCKIQIDEAYKVIDLLEEDELSDEELDAYQSQMDFLYGHMQMLNRINHELMWCIFPDLKFKYFEKKVGRCVEWLILFEYEVALSREYSYEDLLFINEMDQEHPEKDILNLINEIGPFHCIPLHDK